MSKTTEKTPLPVLLVKNIPREGAGVLEEILQTNRIPSIALDLDDASEFGDLQKLGAVIIFGGPDSANDETPRMKKELAAVRRVTEADLPFLGICLGMQVLVKAAGGKVRRHTAKEVGFRDPNGEPFRVDLTEEGASDPLLKGLGRSLPVFQLHGETVELSPDMHLLATGAGCRNQIVRVGRVAYGIQSHVELTGPMFEDWLREDADLRGLDPAALREDFLALSAKVRTTGQRIFENFLRLAGYVLGSR